MDSLTKKFNFKQGHAPLGTVAEYVWLDGYGELRSKIKILDSNQTYSVVTVVLQDKELQNIQR